MPIYEFQCGECGLKFEEVLSIKADTSTHPCADCGRPAPKVLSTFAFNFAYDTNGPGPNQNTGLSSIDTNPDMIIGKDAEKRWAAYEKRQAEKRRVLRDNPDAVKADLKPTADGGFAVLKPEERRAVNTARKMGKEASQAIHARAVKAVERDQKKRRAQATPRGART